MKSGSWRVGVVAATAGFGLALGCAPTDRPESSEPATGAESPDWTPPPLPDGDTEPPDAGAVVRRAAEFIQSQPEFLTEAMVTFGALQESGQTLHFDVLERVAIRRPDKLAWVTLHGITLDEYDLVDLDRSILMKLPELKLKGIQ